MSSGKDNPCSKANGSSNSSVMPVQGESSSAVRPDSVEELHGYAPPSPPHFEGEVEEPQADPAVLVLEVTKPENVGGSMKSADRSLGPSITNTGKRPMGASDCTEEQVVEAVGVSPVEADDGVYKPDGDDEWPNKHHRLEMAQPYAHTMEPPVAKSAAQTEGASTQVLMKQAADLLLHIATKIDQPSMENQQPGPETELPSVDEQQDAPAAVSPRHGDSTFPRSDGILFRDIRNPRQNLRCMIEVNNWSVLGSLDPKSDDWAFVLSFDAGRYKAPRMDMGFIPAGWDRTVKGAVAWCLSDHMNGHWMVDDLEIHRVVEHPQIGKISVPPVLAACKDNGEKQRLIRMSFTAWPNVLKHFRENEWRSPKPYIKKSLKAVFQEPHAYQIRLWFLAPAPQVGEEERFEQRCLAIFLEAFRQRRSPFTHWQDEEGVSFLDQLQKKEPKPIDPFRVGPVRLE
jgi:hypothetical protein